MNKTFPLIRLFDNLAVLALSAFLASLAFPSEIIEDGIGFLAFFYLIPVFYVIYKASWWTVGFYGAWYGFLFYYLYNYWLSTFHPLAILIAPVLESIQYVVLFLALKASSKVFRRRSWIPMLLVYNAYLYLTQQGFLAYPYGNLTAALYTYTSLIQIVSVTGIWGLGLIVTAPQAILAEYFSKRNGRVFKDFGISLLVVGLVWLGGHVALVKERSKTYDEILRIAAIQHSADTWQGGYSTYKANFENLKTLTEEAMEENPDLVVWSETAFVPSVAWHKAYPTNYLTSKLCNDFVEFGKSLSVPLVTGNPEGVINDKTMAAVLDNGDWNWKTYNTVIFFAGGEILGTYRKQHLVPFTEYFPYEKQFPRLYALLKANDYKWWEVGEESTVFSYGGVKYSTPICFEDMFGSLNAAFVEGGAQILLNLTNDFWSRSVQAEKQHMQLAVFRSVENRVPLLRSTNSGITCLVLPSGDIVDPLEPYTMTWGIYEVPVVDEGAHTFYTRHPDLFGKLHVVLAVGLLLYGLAKPLFRKKEGVVPKA